MLKRTYECGHRENWCENFWRSPRETEEEKILIKDDRCLRGLAGSTGALREKRDSHIER
ncbi:MAG: hypothetical protein QXR84_03585 [Candidatus Bathyarchaeia archaeon]|nr:hypothetical protein [Candidatus Bathyarchaeota archaeon]